MLGGFAAIALLLAPCAAAETVLLRAADGTPLSAVWHAPPRQAPAVLLVHMLTRTHREWDVAVPSLRAAGLDPDEPVEARREGPHGLQAQVRTPRGIVVIHG